MSLLLLLYGIQTPDADVPVPPTPTPGPTGPQWGGGSGFGRLMTYRPLGVTVGPAETDDDEWLILEAL